MDEGDKGPAAALRRREPADPDAALHDRVQRRERRRRGAQVLAVIAFGGMAGAAARHGVSLALPTAAGGLPWSTLIVNTSGCVGIGVVMVLIVEAHQAHRLVRPFLGVGVLGGYTTFSAYTMDAQVMIAAGRPGMALGYLAGTAVAALAAVQVGVVLTRALALPHPRTRTGRASPRGGSR
jgi:fluoride exporter